VQIPRLSVHVSDLFPCWSSKEQWLSQKVLAPTAVPPFQVGAASCMEFRFNGVSWYFPRFLLHSPISNNIASEPLFLCLQRAIEIITLVIRVKF